MKVKKEHFIEAMEYLEDVSSNAFFDRLNIKTEEIAAKYKEIQKEKSAEKDKTKKEELNNTLLNLTNELKALYEPYKSVFFYSNVNKAVAYLENVDIEKISNIHIFVGGSNIKEYDLIKKSIENINSILINATILSILWDCSRQYINYLVSQGKIQDKVIGHVTAFKLLDVL